MAPPKKKAGGQPRKQQIIRRRYVNRQYRKRPDIAHREMVYRLLNDKHNQAKVQNRASGSKGDRYHGRTRKYQNTREYSYDSSPSIDYSEYTKSVATSVENLSTDVANSSAASSSENSSVSNVSVKPIVLAKSIDNTRALLKKKSLVQVINNYIKAGIEEGKRQAKKYIRKALSFGVKSGYLIPTDPQGQVIRVSPTLITSKRSDVESRKRRKRARRGEEDPVPDTKEHHQPTPPWNSERKKIARRENTPRPETPPRKRRRTTRNSSQAKKNSRKRNSTERIPRDGKKRNARKRKKDKLMISMLSNVPGNKSDENVLKNTRRTRSSHKCDVNENKEDRRDRRAKSPRAGREDNENSKKNNEDSSNEDADSAKFSDGEVNEGAPIRRRKSTTGREDAMRNGDPSLGNPVRIVEEKLDDPDEGNIENNTIENIN
ncbi:hypothetical protein K0M31_014229 [Melipona bicolor]|uniref:Uncharacterized protein n=1 Tax=Melipona bicolor TaxID=60889 RepID=A0AA40G9B8_9HYME|nr:hypothetical protein K0M31_014229 [Melipona bicolor]